MLTCFARVGLRLALGVVCLAGCEASGADADNQGGSGGLASQASGGLAGTSSASGGSGGGSVLDTSAAAGPCGQYVYDLDAYCAGSPSSCTLVALPDCATLKAQRQPASLSLGCGYAFIHETLGEGDESTTVFDLSTQRLVYLSTRGAFAIGCAVRGMRVGAAPQCDLLVDACESSGGAGGADGR
ncbi:MAG: hypothetical protein QM756_33510 [Polyangiaceae bacterium]